MKLYIYTLDECTKLSMSGRLLEAQNVRSNLNRLHDEDKDHAGEAATFSQSIERKTSDRGYAQTSLAQPYASWND